MLHEPKFLRRCILAAITTMSVSACSARIAPAGVEIAVRRPPPIRVEVRGNAPGNGYIWIEGHHAWRNGDYVWVPGEWVRPPETRYRRWVPGHWQSVRGGWYWVDGHWG